MQPLPTVIFALAMLLSQSVWSGPLSIKVDRVKDGDTILVTFNGKQEQLQLLGIDAPEDVPNPKLQRDMERTQQSQDQLLAIGRLATKHLTQLAARGSSITVEADMDRRDHYGRIPAMVSNSAGRSLNTAMVEDGYAVVMGRYQFDAKLKAAMQKQQESATNNRLGLWGSKPEITKAWGGK